jgi:DNA recombination protein RmuC
MDPENLSGVGLGPDSPAFWLAAALIALAAAALLFSLLSSGGADKRAAKRIDAVLSRIDQLMRDEAARGREDDDRRAREQRDELRLQIETTRNALDERLRAGNHAQSEASTALRGEVNAAVKAFGDSLKQDVDALSRTLKERFGAFSEGLNERQATFEKAVNERLAASTETIAALARGNAEAHAQLKGTVEERLEKLRIDNEAKLEQMRQTVDEKLQSTLEKRLGESFKHVSERLETVHRGLGEMQSLAAGVGDLKKVLTNVKDRGGWAEIQLGALLDQMLAREQYVVNARIDPASSMTVEFAVRFPGPENGREVLLPIDSKFPKEDYERLVAAWEAGDADGARASLDALERVIEGEAKKIGEKYIRPPHSTDFAILFLPTEGLYAEAMRRPGLTARLQSKYKVTVAGPTTLAALLTSFQMGFRTLAIQQRSSEVWQVLGEAKSEFEKYAKVWDKLGQQLQTAQNTVQEAGRRTRAVSRKLRDVETLEIISADPAPSLLDAPLEGDDAED